jgi:hypothetical protein
MPGSLGLPSFHDLEVYRGLVDLQMPGSLGLPSFHDLEVYRGLAHALKLSSSPKTFFLQQLIHLRLGGSTSSSLSIEFPDKGVIFGVGGLQILAGNI